MVAVLYKRDGYDTGSKRLMGRQAAGEGFLKSLVQHGTADPLYCYATHRQEFAEFCDRIRPWMTRPRQVQWLPDSNPSLLAQAGVFYRPDAGVPELAWQRRFFDQRGYSICGLTHTIASKGALQMIGDLLIAPVQPWDALICTSSAVKTAVDQLFNHWADYLEQRLGSRPTPEVQLPVIPLGVDCSVFPEGQAAKDARDRLRQQFNIPPEDIVVLYMGRLIFYAKAHPVPMYLALEQAAQATQTKIHLIQAGWFEDQREENGFKESAQTFCPSVNALFLDGRQPDIRTHIWAASDIFISLADNIQETFGLTPIEAMASGLPVVVSDWNGYQDTIRHEVDGFRIPTLTPSPGMGMDLAARYYADSLNYSTYVGHASLRSSVDVNACAQALKTLIEQSELRQRLGENGRQRAKAVYDWPVVIAAYEELWQELNDRRTAAPMVASMPAGAPPHPLCDDPFRQFAHYPTAALTPDIVLQVTQQANPDFLAHLRNTWITHFGADERVSPEAIAAILEFLTQAGAQPVNAILQRFPDHSPNRLISTLLYLIKFNVLETTLRSPQ
jgi:glycosyltransferase involved in cell wall biosynthesis